MNKRSRLLLILGAGILLGGIFIFFYLTNNRSGLSINLITIPGDATLVFKSDTETVKSKGKESIRLPAGMYAVSGSKDGFQEKNLTVHVKENAQICI